MQKSSPLDFASREVGDDESSAPINAAAAPPALKKAKKLAEKVADNGQPKKPQLRESDALLICTKCIMAKPDQWGVLLTSKYGKVRVQGEFIAFVTDETAGNEQFKGKSGLRESLNNWIKKGMQYAADETARRATAGRGESDESVPGVTTVWFDLMNDWTEYLMDHSTTAARWTTPPPHLQGMGVVLQKVDSPLMARSGAEKAQEKEQGEKSRYEAIAVVRGNREQNNAGAAAGAGAGAGTLKPQEIKK